MAIQKGNSDTSDQQVDTSDLELDEMLYARHVEVESFTDLMKERGTPIPALFTNFYKFIQNPSAVSVETFKRMIDTDDVCGAGMDFLTTCLAARLGDYLHPDLEISEFVNKRLQEIRGGWTNQVKEMLSASWAGFYVGEKVWANTRDGFVIEKIIPLPPTTVLFEVERTGELTSDGILQYQRNWNPMTLAMGIGYFGGVAAGSGWAGQGTAPDPFAKLGDLPFPLRTANTFNYLSIRIPTFKCIHYSFDAQGKFGNPYGRSLLRRIYKYYVMKDTFLQMLAVALDRKGTPLMVVFADPNVTLKRPGQENMPNQKGQRNGIGADEAAREAFKKIHNDTVITLPGKKDQIFSIESIPQDSNAEVFILALDFCNKSMMRGMLIPSLIFGNGDGVGSNSLGQEHSRTFDKTLDGMLSGAKEVLKQSLVKEIIAFNFERERWEKHGLGDFTNRELTQEERQAEMTIVKDAIDAGSIDMNDLDDLNNIREIAGFKPRTEVIPEESLPGFEEEDDDGGDEGKGNKPSKSKKPKGGKDE